MNRLPLLHGLLAPSAFVCRRCQRAAALAAPAPSRLRLDLFPAHVPFRSYASKKKKKTPAARRKTKAKAKANTAAPTFRIRPVLVRSKDGPATDDAAKAAADGSGSTAKKASARRQRAKKTAKRQRHAESLKKAQTEKADDDEEGVPLSSLGRSIGAEMKGDLAEGESVGELRANDLQLGAIPVEQPPVPKLAHGLDRVLFSPGVTQMRDPRSRVYNFGPHLEKLMPIREFDFGTLNFFTPPSKDAVLARIAQESGKKYIASTSSMTGVLKHFHFLLSRWRKPNFDMLSRAFPTPSSSYTKMTKAPDAIFLRWKDGVYAVDADKMYDSANVLSLMGRYMEKLMTEDESAFARHRVGAANPITDAERAAPESFHYSTLGDFLLRSQLDAHDARLPGNGMFDLKTRAVVPIRMDSGNFAWGMDYEIRALRGEWQSYEREYHDMIRSTMLKYSLQVRMGRMDGIFVAFHNIARIFGFQYVSLDEMDYALHGQTGRALGDAEFLLSLGLMNEVFDRATARFPRQTIRFHFEARETKEPIMYIFAEPVSDAQADEIQDRNKEKIRQWEESILSGKAPEETPRTEAPRKIDPAALQEERDDVTSTILDGTSPSTSPSSTTDPTTSQPNSTKTPNPKDTKDPAKEDEEEPTKPLLALILATHSTIDGRPAPRPDAPYTRRSDWRLRYTLAEPPSPRRAHTLYAACKARRERELGEDARRGAGADEDDYFFRVLRRLAREGREWRAGVERAERGGVVRMWDSEGEEQAPPS